MKITCLITSCLQRIKMRYSVEPRDRIYVKGYEFLSFDKNMGKNLSNKYDQKLLDNAKKSTTDAIKTASKKKSNSKNNCSNWCFDCEQNF